MALIKIIETSTGLNAEYWKIASYHYMPETDQSRIVLYGYADKAKRNAGKLPVTTINYVFNQDPSDKKTMYELVKTKPEFDGSVDDI